MDSPKRKVIELVSGMRFGIGVGRFTVEKVTDELCQVSYNRKAGSATEATFYLPKEPLENLIQIEETERLLKNAEEKARYWKEQRNDWHKRNHECHIKLEKAEKLAQHWQDDRNREFEKLKECQNQMKAQELLHMERLNAKGAYIDDLNQRLLDLNKITIEKDDAIKVAKREIRELEDELAAANRRYRHHIFLIAFANVAFFLGFAAYIACFV